MYKRCCLGLIGLGAGLVVFGCAAPHRRAEIPLGEWRGQGVFVSEQRPAKVHAGGDRRGNAQHGEYPTELKIEAVTGGTPGTVRVEILSQRGHIQDMNGDRTHLIAELEPVKSLADESIRLYRLRKFGLALDATAQPDVDEEEKEEMRASCMVVGADLILRIHYSEGFVDTFRFRDGVLYKDGSLFPSDGEGLIHWSETLQRRR